MPRSAPRVSAAIMVAVVAGLALATARPAAGQMAAHGDASGADAVAGAQSAPTGEGATYPVAARDLERGEVLTTEDIAHVALPGGEAAPEDAPESLVGWTTRRVIAAGDALREPAVSPPDLVRAGEPVHAVYQGRTIVLRVAGTAAGSGSMGDRVLVRVDARRRLQGVVIGPALVLLDSNESR